jgi:hypothetical protein
MLKCGYFLSKLKISHPFYLNKLKDDAADKGGFSAGQTPVCTVPKI